MENMHSLQSGAAEAVPHGRATITVPHDQFRLKSGDWINEVRFRDKTLILTRSNKPACVVVSYVDWLKMKPTAPSLDLVPISTDVAGKRCGRCEKTQPRSAFAKSSAHPSGLQNWCRACHREYEAEKRVEAKKKAPRVLRAQDSRTFLSSLEPAPSAAPKRSLLSRLFSWGGRK